jgi:cyclopropane fatty-acyl-phospholipid synthase-like methyltransferase
MKVLFRSSSFLCVLLVANACSVPVWTDGEVPFVPTPVQVVDRMLEMARVTPEDIVYDLGSGDGAIIIRAAKKFGVRGVGIEIDADLVRKAQGNAFKERVEHLVEFRVQDALAVDVSQATVVTLYMLPEFNAKLRPILDRQLKPGARVVSHDFPVEGWVPDRVERVSGDFLHDHTILLFEIR